MKLAKFNTLPPKPEWVQSIKNFIELKGTVSVADILEATRLTKTQALCTIEVLLREESIARTGKSEFKRTQTSQVSNI